MCIISGRIDKSINIVYTALWRISYGSSGKKWGNSLGIRIPNLIARELSLKDGSCVDINNIRKKIIPIKKNRLSEMVSKINKQNFHAEIETGEPVGKEIW
jgi:antitoxin MazE